MDRCQELRPSLDALVDGELAPELRAGFEAHLATCAACASERTRLERTNLVLRNVTPPAAADWQRMIANARGRVSGMSSSWWERPRTLAATILLAIAIPTLLGLTLRPRPRPCKCDLISPRPAATMEL